MRDAYFRDFKDFSQIFMVSGSLKSAVSLLINILYLPDEILQFVSHQLNQVDMGVRSNILIRKEIDVN